MFLNEREKVKMRLEMREVCFREPDTPAGMTNSGRDSLTRKDASCFGCRTA